MYSILTDHIYIIKSSIFIPLTSKIQTLSPIRFYLFFLLKFHFFLNLFSINLYNYYYDNVFFTFINNIISYIYNFLLFLLGNQTNTYYDNMDSPSFFNDDSLQSSLFNTYDDSSKVLFSDNNSNIFSLQGKLLNIEELFLLTKLSSDLNLLKFNRIYPLYTKFIEKQSTNSFIILLNKYYSNIENNNNSLSLGKLIKFFILILIYIDKFLSIFRLPKVKPEISNNFYSNNYSNSNFIFNINFNIQDLFFYNRRLDNIYYSLNPFLTIFNDIFSLNDNTNSLYSHKEPGNYK